MTSNPESAIDWSGQLEQNRSWLTKVLRARIGNSHDVEDVFQELSLSVLTQVQRRQESAPTDKSPVPSNPEKIAPWLYRLAVRHAVNFYRKTNRLTHARPTESLNPPADTFEPLNWIVANEEQTQFQLAFLQLPPGDREILTLKYAEKWTYQQLADKLGATVRNIEYRLLNARKQLRHQLKLAGRKGT